jgi:hypothetical protein
MLVWESYFFLLRESIGMVVDYPRQAALVWGIHLDGVGLIWATRLVWGTQSHLGHPPYTFVLYSPLAFVTL